MVSNVLKVRAILRMALWRGTTLNPPLIYTQKDVISTTISDNYKLLFIDNQRRCYAKGKDKKKSDKGKGHKVVINEAFMLEVVNVDKMKSEMEVAVEKMKDEYVKNLSLRSSIGSIENLKIQFEGKTHILMELAQIMKKSPKTIIINMSSFPQVIPSVLKALSTSGMNLNPQQDGTSIFIPVPKVTKEHREVLSKNAKSLFIKCRDSIKEVQNKFLRVIKNKEKDGLSSDIGHEVSQQVISVGDQYISQAEKIMETKQAELLRETS